IALDGAPNGVPPVVVKIGNRPAKGFAVRADTKLIAADFFELLESNSVLSQDRHRLFETRGRGRNYNPRLRLVEESSASISLAIAITSQARGLRYINFRAKKLLGIETAFR